MSATFLAEFRDVERLKLALGRLREARHAAIDTFTPYPVQGLEDQLEDRPSRIGLAMLLGGFGVAVFAFGLQWYSAVIDYPINSGGRPLNSWPVFLLVPFEVGVFAAALSGVIALLWSCGLPRLHHPLFDIPGFERATQDRYYLLAASGENSDGALDLRHLLEHAGAVVVTEMRQP